MFITTVSHMPVFFILRISLDDILHFLVLYLIWSYIGCANRLSWSSNLSNADI